MYQIKLYTKAKVYKKTINLTLIKNRINFTKQINGWLWQLTLVLNLWLSNTDFIQWDIIEVYNFDAWVWTFETFVWVNTILAWRLTTITRQIYCAKPFATRTVTLTWWTWWYNNSNTAP